MMANYLFPENTVIGSREKSVFIATEPPSVKRYDNRFLDQFGYVVTTDPLTKHPNFVLSQPGLCWWAGKEIDCSRYCYDFFKAFDPPKSKLISVITSSSNMTVGHCERILFVNHLRKRFGPELSVFGRGIRPINDKLEALEDYHFHIAIENSRQSHYWTEKIADPLLTLTYPIYHGASNLAEYFPKDSFSPIDIKDPQEAYLKIKKIIDADLDSKRRADLLEARRRLLNQNNLFLLIPDLLGKLPYNCSQQENTFFQPESYFEKRFFSKAKRFLCKVPLPARTKLKQKRRQAQKAVEELKLSEISK